MKKVKYLGGGWTDNNEHYPETFQLTVGKVYDFVSDDQYYGVKSDTSEEIVYEHKYLFTIVEDDNVILNPEQVEVGKLYQSVLIGEAVLYMGCQNYDTKEKFLLIVVDDDDGCYTSVGLTVSMDLTMPIWKSGFVEKS